MLNFHNGIEIIQWETTNNITLWEITLREFTLGEGPVHTKSKQIWSSIQKNVKMVLSLINHCSKVKCTWRWYYTNIKRVHPKLDLMNGLVRSLSFTKSSQWKMVCMKFEQWNTEISSNSKVDYQLRLSLGITK